jgi:hypothetical protein
MTQLIRLLLLATATSFFVFAGCANQKPMPDVPGPEECRLGEYYICVGGSASKLKTEQSKQGEICRCRTLSDVPQMEISGVPR